MTAPNVDAPCSEWATEADLCSPCDDYAFDADTLAEALDVASSVLYKLSGRQFAGQCRETVLVGDPCVCPVSAPIVRRNLQRGRSTCTHDRMTLRGYPIREIHSVAVDGVKLVQGTDFRVEDFRDLVRLGGESWAAEVEVDYSFGQEPPPEGVHAAAVLACEIALACNPESAAGGAKCRLPKRVQSVTRQGVSLAFVDPFDFLDKGKTGVLEVDLFLQAVNPGGNASRPAVYSPDLPSRGRRIT